MKTNIVIIGTGNIGRRHLQAVSALDLPAGIACYDSRPDALESLPGFCAENGVDVSRIQVIEKIEELNRAVTKETAVIVATTAKGRKDIIASLIARQPLAILAEKPLCQSLKEYDQIVSLAAKYRVPVYVNFSRHMLDFYQDIHSQINDAKRKSFYAHFPGGMACIGIHMLELMTWMLGAKTFKLISSSCGKVYETKRQGFYDFSGEMLIEANKGGMAYLSATEKEDVFSIGIFSESAEFVVYEFAKKMVRADSSRNAQFSDIHIPFTSQLTDKVIRELEARRATSLLPDISHCRLAHKILFEYMAAHGIQDVNVT